MSDDLSHPSPDQGFTKVESQEISPVHIGQTVGGYRLDRVLGQGSAGSVYLGTHTMLGRRSAIKVLSRRLSHLPDVARRFFHEARIVNDIRHANIVDIVDFVHTTNPTVLAYVMEYISGPSLQSVLAERRMTQVQVVNVCMQLSSALKAAHDLGVIHRDLKPENVLLVESPNSDLSIIPSVKILDFGVAKIANKKSDNEENTQSLPTVSGGMMGTPRYMAPEQITNEQVSSKTDVYALTELFYEMLTGQPVFVGSNMAVFQAKLSGQEIPLVFPSDVPNIDYLNGMVRQGLARDPECRLSLEEFNVALDGWLNAESATPFESGYTSEGEVNQELLSTNRADSSSLPGESAGSLTATLVNKDQNSSAKSLWGGIALAVVLVLVALFLGRSQKSQEPTPDAPEKAVVSNPVPKENSSTVQEAQVERRPAKGSVQKPAGSSAAQTRPAESSAAQTRPAGVTTRVVPATKTQIRPKVVPARAKPVKAKPIRKAKKRKKKIQSDDPMESTDLPQW